MIEDHPHGPFPDLRRIGTRPALLFSGIAPSSQEKERSPIPGRFRATTHEVRPEPGLEPVNRREAAMASFELALKLGDTDRHLSLSKQSGGVQRAASRRVVPARNECVLVGTSHDPPLAIEVHVDVERSRSPTPKSRYSNLSDVLQERFLGG